MKSVKEKFIDMYRPTGQVLYDVVIPITIFLLGIFFMAVFGFMEKNTAYWCFSVVAFIHLLLTMLAWLSGRLGT